LRWSIRLPTSYRKATPIERTNCSVRLTRSRTCQRASPQGWDSADRRPEGEGHIAEGVGEYALNERRRFLRISRRSGLEAASQLLVIQRHKQADPHLLQPALVTLHRIVCMLTRMISATKDRRIG
jgi:hypothetical protein